MNDIELSKVFKRLHSITELINLLDLINQAYSERIKSNKVHELFNLQILQAGYENRLINHYQFPFEFICYNRQYHQLKRDRKFQGCKLYWIHGHDLNDPAANHTDSIFLADDAFGKELGSYVTDDNGKDLYLPKYKFIYLQS